MTGRMQLRKQGEDGDISREMCVLKYYMCEWNAHLGMIVSLEYLVEYTRSVLQIRPIKDKLYKW